MSMQDYTFLLAPGESEHVGVGEADFIFVKQADRPVDFVLDQGTVRLAAGGEYESKTGLFSSFEVVNTDTQRPIKVVVAIGTERYRTTIITGEVVVDPRIKTVDGTFESDQRAQHAVSVSLDYKREPVITAGSGTVGATVPISDYLEGFRSINGVVIDDTTIQGFYNGTNEYAVKFDRATGLLIDSDAIATNGLGGGTQAGIPIGGSSWVIADGEGWSYQWTYGQPNPIEVTDRINQFRVEGPFIINYFVNPENGDIHAIDAQYKTYNITKQKKLFNNPNSALRQGFFYKGDIWLISASPDEFRVMRENASGIWEQVDVIPITGAGLRGAGGGNYLASEDAILVLETDSIDEDYQMRSYEPESYGGGEIHYGRATEQCTTIPALLNPAILSEVRTPAAVSVSWENGKAYVSGEVIKAILDLLGIDTSGNYLDGITGFRAVADGSVIDLQLGGRTFAADDIADDFTRVLFPQTVQITAQNSLWSNRK